MDELQRFWFTASRKLHTIWLPTAAAVLTALITGGVEQLQQIITTLLTQSEPNFLLGIAAVNFFGLSIWYSARILFTVEHEGDFAGATRGLWVQKYAEWTEDWVPRILPLLPLGVVASLLPGWVERLWFLLFSISMFSLANISRAIYLTWDEELNLWQRIAAPFQRSRADYPETRKSFTRWLSYWWFVIAMALVAFGLSLFLNAFYASAPMAFGSVALFYFGATGLLVGSLPFAILAVRFRFPVLLLTVVAVFFIGSTGNHHEIKTIAQAKQNTEDPTALTTVNTQTKHCTSVTKDILIAAEGGGIRSAYWLASVLTEAQMADPTFHCRIAMISSVSGGNIGAVAYVLGYLHQSAFGINVSQTPYLRDKLQKFLGYDFLASMIGGLMFADLPASTLPSAWFPADRAVFFEAALDTYWRRDFPRIESVPGMADGYDKLVDPDGSVPALYLNTTRVNSGTREFITSDPHYQPSLKNDPNVARLLPAPISVATAAHLGARFPLVSPPGELPVDPQQFVNCEPDERCFVSYVDGGYYENFGLETLIHYATRRADTVKEWKVLIIGNGRAFNIQDSSFNRAETHTPPAMEITQPINGLVNTRSGRALANLQAIPDPYEVLVAESCWQGVSLGWTTNAPARRRMNEGARIAARDIVAFLNGTASNTTTVTDVQGEEVKASSVTQNCQ